MALRGNLRDFSFTQLLNLISLANKTGTLVVEGPAKEARVSFQNGKLAFASIGNDNGGLAYVLHRARRLSSSQYHSIQARAPHMGDKELGLLLINGGYVTQEDILQNVQAHVTEVVRSLFTWVEGLPVADVARVLGVAPGTVKSRLSRARDALREGGSA